MDAEVFDYVKFEKEKAIARFNSFRKIAKLWQVFEVVVVLVVISWWTTNIPAAVKLSGEFLSRVSACLFNPHVVFIIGNAIIVALFVLCKRSDGVEFSGGVDLYDEYTEAQGRLPSGEAPSSPEKEVITSSTEDPSKAEEDQQRWQIVVAEAPETKPEVVEPAVAEAEEQIRRFQRTQSARLRREIAVRPRKELRRSETEFRRRMRSGTSETVDELSNEEFKLAVDAFIDKHQRFFKLQKMAEAEGVLKC